MSSRVGNARPAKRHGVSTATGWSSSIARHTEGSCALAPPWCGTLNAVPRICGRPLLPTILTQPFASRSAPRRMTISPARIHSTTATLFGNMSGIRVFVSPSLGNNGAIALRKRTNSLLCGDNDQISHVLVVRIRTSARTKFGIRSCSTSVVNTRWSSPTPDPPANEPRPSRVCTAARNSLCRNAPAQQNSAFRQASTSSFIPRM